MYVLTEGWYSDMEIKGVTYDETQARAWSDSDTYRECRGPFEMGWPSAD
jgi:hypothetical protein